MSCGYGVARYVSLEQRIFESKNTYYARLYESQQGWRTAENAIWPWVSYLASILSGAYDDFEQRVAAAGATAVAEPPAFGLLNAPAWFASLNACLCARPQVRGNAPTLEFVLGLEG